MNIQSLPQDILQKIYSSESMVAADLVNGPLVCKSFSAALKPLPDACWENAMRGQRWVAAKAVPKKTHKEAFTDRIRRERAAYQQDQKTIARLYRQLASTNAVTYCRAGITFSMVRRAIHFETVQTISDLEKKTAAQAEAFKDARLPIKRSFPWKRIKQLVLSWLLVE